MNFAEGKQRGILKKNRIGESSGGGGRVLSVLGGEERVRRSAR